MPACAGVRVSHGPRGGNVGRGLTRLRARRGHEDQARDEDEDQTTGICHKGRPRTGPGIETRYRTGCREFAVGYSFLRIKHFR